MTEPFSTLIDMFDRCTRTHAERDLFGTKKNGRWRWMTYGDFRTAVDSCRAGLKLAGVEPGDRVGIVSNNRVEWAVAAMAAVAWFGGQQFDWLAMRATPLLRAGALFLVIAACGAVYFGALLALGFRVRDFRRTGK